MSMFHQNFLTFLYFFVIITNYSTFSCHTYLSYGLFHEILFDVKVIYFYYKKYISEYILITLKCMICKQKIKT